MCWYSTTKNKLIAEEDISVYKIVRKLQNNICDSIYKFYKYNKGEEYVTPICFEENIVFGYTVHSAFHSYKYLSMIRVRGDAYDVFTSNHTWKIDNIPFPCHIAEFIIPKDSIYYENAYGEIISNKIIFKDYVLGY